MATCACIRLDAFDCSIARDETRAWLYNLRPAAELCDPCGCHCHEPPDDGLDDEERDGLGAMRAAARTLLDHARCTDDGIVVRAADFEALSASARAR